jgi:D-sedoheptulose 7-phosphate isomerase
MMTIEKLLGDSVAASIALKQKVLETLAPQIAVAGRLLVDAYRQGNKAIFFGNGGSAADAQHLAAELECRFAFDRRPLPALALHGNSSATTAISNDYSYEQLYARLLTAHARPGDVAIAISTSGTSKNVVAAARLKKDLQIKLIALTGEKSDVLAPYADCVIAVPSRDTPRIQEAHITIGHVLCEWIEAQLFKPADV